MANGPNIFQMLLVVDIRTTGRCRLDVGVWVERLSVGGTEDPGTAQLDSTARIRRRPAKVLRVHGRRASRRYPHFIDVLVEVCRVTVAQLAQRT